MLPLEEVVGQSEKEEGGRVDFIMGFVENGLLSNKTTVTRATIKLYFSKVCRRLGWYGNTFLNRFGVGSLSLLHGIFPTQGLNPGLPHYRWILYQLSYKGSPRMLKWVAYLFSSGSSQPRNQTGVSCIASGFFTNWAMREGTVAPKNGLDLITP